MRWNLLKSNLSNFTSIDNSFDNIHCVINVRNNWVVVFSAGANNEVCDISSWQVRIVHTNQGNSCISYWIMDNFPEVPNIIFGKLLKVTVCWTVKDHCKDILGYWKNIFMKSNVNWISINVIQLKCTMTTCVDHQVTLITYNEIPGSILNS